jgi:hypothetical protein
MKHPLLATALLGLALVLPGAAQTITPGNPDNSFYAEEIPFLVNSDPVLSQLAGLNVRTVPGYGPGYVYDFCADFLTGADDLATFNVSPGLGGGLGSGQQDEIEALFSHALPTFVEMLNSYILANGGDWAEQTDGPLGEQFNALVGYAGGMQVALWEIIHETSGDLSIDSEGSMEGNFRVEPVNPANPRAEIARENAETFLLNIRDGVWVDTGGINYYYADPLGEDQQDRLWVTVPEPSSALLGALGLLAVIRRRRA